MQKRSLARRLLVVAALIAGAAVLALRTEAAGDAMCSTLRREIPSRLGLEVGIARCRIDPLSQTVRLSGVSVFEASSGDEPVIAAEEAEVSLRNVFPGFVTLDWVKLIHPRVTLEVDPPVAAVRGVKKTCPLTVLDRLRVQHLEVQGAELKLSVRGKGRAELDGLDVEWRFKKGVLSARVELKGGAVEWGAPSTGSGRAQRARLSRSLFEGDLDVDDEALSIQRGEVGVDGVRLTATGSIEELCDVEPKLALNAQLFLPVAQGVKLVGGEVSASGNLWSRLQVSGRPSAPSVKAEVQGSDIVLDRFRPGDFTARLAWAGKEVAIEDFFTKAGNGTVRVSGSVKLETGLPAKFKVETVDASLGRILERASLPGAWVELSASVKGTVSGTLTPRPNLQGDPEVHASHFVLAARPFDGPVSAGPTVLEFPRGDATLHLAIGPERVEMTQIRASLGEGHTQVQGSVTLNYDPAKGIEVHAAAEPAVLADFGHIAGLPWAGVGTARVDIVGPYSDVSLSGQVALRDFKFADYSLGVVQSPLGFRGELLRFDAISGQKGKTQFFGDLGLTFKKGGDLLVRSTVNVPKGRSEDIADVLAGLHPTLESFQGGVLTGDLTGSAKIDSPAKHLAGTIDLQLADTRYWGRVLGEGPVRLRFDDGQALVLDGATFKGPLGLTRAKGRWEFAGPLQFSASVSAGSLAELFADFYEVTGPFEAEATVSGDTDMPLVDGKLTSTDVRRSGSSMGPAKLEAHLVGKELKVTGAPFADARGEVTLHTRAPYPWAGTLDVAVEDLKSWLPDAAAKQGLGGSFAGKLVGSGDLDSMDSLSVRAELNQVTLSRGEIVVSNQAPVVLGWARRQLRIDPVWVKGTNTELQAEGTWGPQTADVKLHGEVDLRLLESFSTSLERTTGQLELTAAITGSVKEPALVGSAEVKDARFGVRDQPVAVRSLNGHLEFSKSRVLLQGFEGFMNDGRVSARGDVRLEGTELKSLELAVDLEQVVLALKPDLPATLTGSLLVYGKPNAYQLSGGLDVLKLRYTQNLELDALLKNIRNSSHLIQEEQKPVEWLRLDVDLNLGNDVRIDNNLARAQFTGRLKLTGTNLKPQLIGTVEAAEGSVAMWRGNVLNVGKGVMVFNGLVPTVDLNAQAQVREYLVNVKAFGRLDDPKVSLTAQPPLAEAEVLTLLTLGITSKESVGQVGGYSLAGEVLFNASGLDTHLQRFLSKSVGLKDQQIHLSTSFNPATGQAEPSVSWESTVLTDNLKVGVTQPVTGRGTKAQAEYKFNDKVSARAQWDNQTQESSVGNPGVDLKVRFEWE
ncbi:MAG: translocation/assembly module TamB [Archangiaceae bacterium]|nr:translocation/assembly module TamB [Archangiaceae bacterium]